MRLAENSVRMRNLEGEEYGREDGLLFYGTEEGVRRALKSATGKALLVSDEGSCGAFADAACSPRALSLVFDGDCLPLFSMPDTISCVLAAGGAEVLRAARYFAEVRAIPCTLFPVHGGLSGAFEAKGEVLLGEECTSVHLQDGAVVCDIERLAPSLAGAYGRLLLSRLARIESAALAAFGVRSGAEFPPAELRLESAEEVLEENARQRLFEREGAPLGEGVVLARLLKERGERACEWRAYLQLAALYAAFFEKGKPRRYFTPDYRARAERAGTEYTLAGVPSAEEYVLRAMTLERVRAEFARETLSLVARREEFYGTLSKWAKNLPFRGGDLSALQTLPEHAPGGLSSIIRDFGLMEWGK